MSNEHKRDRSPNCPKQSLEDAVKLAKTLHARAGKTKVQPLVVASTLGYGGLNGAALTAIGALNQYGLLDKDEKGLFVSADAVAILHPTNEAQRLDLLREMAMKPKVFKDLYTGGFHKCDESVLANHLIQNGFTTDAAKKVASVFKQNTELAKLDDESINALEMKRQKEQTAAAPPLGETFRGTASPFASLFAPPPPPPEQSELTVPIGNRVAKVPFPVSEEDFDLFIDTLKLWKRKLIRKTPSIPPSVKFPADATWKNKDIDKPVKIVAIMGQRDGMTFYQSSDGTGIPDTELSFVPQRPSNQA
jgi:hypothetical protein